MVLLTGFNGFVGAALRAELQHREKGFLLLEREPTLERWQVVLTQYMESHPVDTVIACGAISNNQYGATDIFDWNTYSMKVLAEQCARVDAHLIYFSSQAAIAPTTLYGHSKKLAEALIRGVQGLSACVLRPFNIWGKGESRKMPGCQSLPYRLAARTLEVLWETERDYIHISDVVQAVMLARQYRIAGTFEVGTGDAVTSDALAERVTWNGYRREQRPPHIQKYACANAYYFLPGWQPAVGVLDRFDAFVEELTYAAAAG